MALQEEGWPLGLLNGRIGLVETGSDFSGSILTASSTTSFTLSSPDHESQSPESLFHVKTTTLGTLIVDSRLLELPQRSTRERTVVDPTKDNKKSYRMKPWLLSLCSRQTTDAVTVKDGPSLSQYLEAERRAATSFRFNHSFDAASHFPPNKCSNSLS